MRSLTLFTAAVAIGAAAAGAALAARDTPEVAYQRLIADKTAGAPQDCIDTRFTKPTLSAIGDRLVYAVDRKLVYVSETQGGCRGVARGDALVTRQFQTRLCRGDIARTINFPARIETGSCALGPFVPYRANKP